MKPEDVRTIAKSHGIKYSYLSKTELIKAIQTEEGNTRAINISVT